MSRLIEIDDTLLEAQSLVTALFLAAGSIGNRQDSAAFQTVAMAAQDSIRHARSLIDDGRSAEPTDDEAHLIRDAEENDPEADLIELGSDIIALTARFERLKVMAGGRSE